MESGNGTLLGGGMCDLDVSNSNILKQTTIQTTKEECIIITDLEIGFYDFHNKDNDITEGKGDKIGIYSQ